jgi:hypothetical protein
LLSCLFNKHHSNGSCCQTAAPCCETAAPSCAAPAGDCCATACNTGCCQRQCCADPCEIAKVIYCSQTACYADDRKAAIDDLGDNYDCVCNPEIMVALIYALNDADEEVRAEAADEIGDQLKNNCCCTPEVIAALTCALRDCDKDVRSEAEEALEACGYEVVDGCCNTGCCSTGCGTGCNTGCCSTGCDATGGSATPAPAPVMPGDEEAAPAPAPPEEPRAYFPSQIRSRQSSMPVKSRGFSGLSDLLDEQY